MVLDSSAERMVVSTAANETRKEVTSFGLVLVNEDLPSSMVALVLQMVSSVVVA